MDKLKEILQWFIILCIFVGGVVFIDFAYKDKSKIEQTFEVTEDEEVLVEVQEIEPPYNPMDEPWFDDLAYMMAQTVYGEAKDCDDYQKSMVCWCILNRYDCGLFTGDTIEEIITAENQFHGYKSSHPIRDDCYNIAVDVLKRWAIEKHDGYVYGRTLPEQYVYFYGDGVINHFRDRNGNHYDCSMPNPYPVD